jgi:anti-sigma factor RsiW
MSGTVNGCEGVRRALGRLADGEADPREARQARAHLEGCAACRGHEALLGAVALRFAERAGPPGSAAPEGLREAVLARVRAGEAAVLDLQPFLRRTALAAAAVFLAATGLALWQESRFPGPSRLDPEVSREDILAQIVRLRAGR